MYTVDCILEHFVPLRNSDATLRHSYATNGTLIKTNVLHTCVLINETALIHTHPYNM